MVIVDKELFKHLIVYGKDCGSTFGYINDDKEILYNIYVREYQDYKYILAENELTEEYFAITPKDKYVEQSKYSEAMSDLKSSLEDVVAILKEIKEGD